MDFPHRFMRPPLFGQVSLLFLQMGFGALCIKHTNTYDTATSSKEILTIKKLIQPVG